MKNYILPAAYKEKNIFFDKQSINFEDTVDDLAEYIENNLLEDEKMLQSEEKFGYYFCFFKFLKIFIKSKNYLLKFVMFLNLIRIMKEMKKIKMENLNLIIITIKIMF